MKYQYCVIYKQENQSEQEWLNELNQLGDDGWRVVSIIGATELEYEKAYLEKITK